MAYGWAFASPPQSGLAWLCFLFPLIEPDRRISRIRLSEKGSRFRPRKAARPRGKADKAQLVCREAAEYFLVAGPRSLCLAHSHWRSLLRA